MRMPFRVVPAGLILVLMGGCGYQKPAPAALDPAAATLAGTAAVDSLNKAFAAAIAARDTDAIAALYADDARFLPAGMPMADGRAAIREVWAGLLRTPGLQLSTQPLQVIVANSGEMAVDVGTYRLVMQAPKSKAVEDVGKFVTVARKTDAGWKWIVDTFNSDKAPAGK